MAKSLLTTLVILVTFAATSLAGTGTIRYSYDNGSRISLVKYIDSNGTEIDVSYDYNYSNSSSTSTSSSGSGSSGGSDFFGCSLSNIPALPGVVNTLILLSGIGGVFILRRKKI